MRSFASLVALAVTVALLLPASARAQADFSSPYSTSVYKEGAGFRLGNSPLVLDLGLTTELGYDTNIFYLPSNEIGSTILRLRAHVDLSTLSSHPQPGDHSTVDPKLDFRFSAQAEYREFLSTDPDVVAQRSINLIGGMDVGILPRGPYTLRIVDTFLRTVDPRNEESVGNFVRDYNRAGVIGSYHAGKLEVGFSDFFTVNLYESADISFGNNLSDEGELYARYKLLSRTLLFVSARFGYLHYDNDPEIGGTPLRVLAGVSTLFASWLGASLGVGYGNSFSIHGASFNSVIGSAEVRFLLPKAARISIGAKRDFFDTLLASGYVDDQIYLAFDQPFTSRVSAHLDGSVRFRDYFGLVDPAEVGAIAFSSSTRSDRVYEAHAEITVSILKWLAANASYNLLYDDTDFAFDTPTPTPVHYLKQSAFVRLDFAY